MKLKKIFSLGIFFESLYFILFNAALVFASDPTPLKTVSVWDNMKASLVPIGKNAFGLSTGVPPDIRAIAALIIKVFIIIFILVFFLIIFYAGYVWMTANGEEDKIQKAKGTLRTGIIGIIVIFLSYSITRFVVMSVYCTTQTFSDFCSFFARTF